MADLPQERVQPSPPFTYCGMDCFEQVWARWKKSSIHTIEACSKLSFFIDVEPSDEHQLELAL
jgi:hypothetical protein